MPKQKPIIFLREKISEMMQQTSRAVKPVYAAAGMLAIAAALTLSVVIGLGQSKPYTAQPVIPPAASPPEVRAAVEVQVQPQLSPQPTAKPANLSPNSSPPPQTQAAEVKAVSRDPGTALRPLKGEAAVQYGWQLHPVFKDWRTHNGIDIMGAEGDTVSAVWSGEVTEIFQDKTAGLTVAVVSGEYTVYYGSLAGVEVRKGAMIKAGSRIGTIGSSQAEPYAHLHLALKKGEKYIDPGERL